MLYEVITNDLSEFTHHLETIFDLIRNDKLAVDSTIISLTFESIDHIRHLLDVGDLETKHDIDVQKKFINRLQSAAISENEDANHEDISPKSDVDGSQVYLIDFVPNEDVLRNGTNPLYLLDDLHAMGKAKVIAYTQKIPERNNFV